MAELILDNVSKRYDKTAVVRQFSAQLKAGRFVALLGPSGCGKTTILRLLAGFERVDGGSIRMEGEVISSPHTHRPAEARHMSMVFQSYALWPHMTVQDNVGYSLKLNGISGQQYRRQVAEALATVNLVDYEQRYPAELSGGQRQRVALARCLVSAPKVVLLDEPLANLDVHLRESMQAHFRRFHEQTQATIIYVTHDQGEAMALADDIAVMHQGQLMQFDTPEQLYQAPRNEWVARFIGDGSILSTTPTGGEATNWLIRPQHVQLHSSLAHQAINHPSQQNVPADFARPLKSSIEQRTYRGARYDYRARIEGGQHLDFYSEQRLEPGDTVLLTITQATPIDAP